MGVIVLKEPMKKGMESASSWKLILSAKKALSVIIFSQLCDSRPGKDETRAALLDADGAFFKKIIITKDAPAPYYNDDGVLVMWIYDFLLNENSLES